MLLMILFIGGMMCSCFVSLGFFSICLIFDWCERFRKDFVRLFILVIWFCVLRMMVGKGSVD